MSAAREKACKKQRERCNAPEDTRRTEEEKRDHGMYQTGLAYRKWVNLPRGERFRKDHVCSKLKHRRVEMKCQENENVKDTAAEKPEAEKPAFLDAEGLLLKPGRYIKLDLNRNCDSYSVQVAKAGNQLWYEDGRYWWRVDEHLHPDDAKRFLRIDDGMGETNH